jgi:hypothetical protein
MFEGDDSVVDAQLSLAISVHSNPGVYALVLASGVSRSSGVPTGGEVVEHLIRKLATLMHESSEPDARGWYRSKFGKEPEYSEILNDVARSPSERMQLLRAYFEPTEEERADGIKMPTPAHRSIADLVVRGYIRVLVTTNFDRLMELALADVGVQAAVVSTDAAAKGALPLAHSRCTIIKVNGDYLDPTLRNTSDELSSYGPHMEKLLDQVLDEYGLIVCGWSAEWDTGLRAAIERCPSRRFNMYWASRGNPADRGQRLIDHRKGTAIDIKDADEFFGKLADGVVALEALPVSHLLSAKVALARMKRHLPDPVQQIKLHDLVGGETEKAYAILNGPRFLLRNLSYDDIRNQINSYNAGLEAMIRLIICGVRWGDANQDLLLLRAYKRLTDLQVLAAPTVPDIRRYTGLILLYAAGVAACAALKYAFLQSLLKLRVHFIGVGEKSVVTAVYSDAVLGEYDQAQVFGGRYLPEYLFAELREPLKEYLPGDYEYESTFDWFEYLFALCHCDASVTRPELETKRVEDPSFVLVGPIGRFGLHNCSSLRPGIQAETEPRKGEPYPQRVAAVLRAGFFESGGQLHDDKYRDVKAAFDRYVLGNRAGPARMT